MRVIGLTGGIGSGKSTVARMLVQRGAALIDADAIARDVVKAGSPALAELAAAFGSDILAEDGELERALLAQRAFATPEGTDLLNAITHPRIRTEAQVRLASLPPETPLVVVDMPLLVEGALAGSDVSGRSTALPIDLVVVVDVPDDVQVQRAKARGMDESDVRRRMGAQASRAARLAAADEVIDNSGTLAETEEQVDALWQRLRAS